MSKSRIYTKTGDKGETGLVSGTRISKSDLRIDLYGELDNFNSVLGFAASHIETTKELSVDVEFLHRLQSVVFDLGSNLACEPEKRAVYKLPQINQNFLNEMESQIDRISASLPELKHFILPGGAIGASAFHMARTSARNVERKLVKFHNETHEEIPALSLELINRTSDYLFVLARLVNQVHGVVEKKWIPQK